MAVIHRDRMRTILKTAEPLLYIYWDSFAILPEGN